MDAQALRDEAQKYRRLANSIYNPTAATELENYARTLDECAARLEEVEHLPERPDDAA